MRSGTLTELTKALVKVQAELQPAPKDGKNPAFKSRYATLAGLWEVARGPLTAHGLAVAQTVEHDDGGHQFLITTLLHESGEFVDSTIEIAPVQNTPQGFGSALTYARRYGLSALVGLVADDDDDGNAASQSQPQRQQAPPPAPTKVNGNGKSVTPSDGIRRALHARGTEIFGEDWDAARHWMVGVWTAKHTPDNRRHSSAELTDEEMVTIVSGLNQSGDDMLRRWQQYQAAAAITVAGSPELAL